jgi:hypothetical protein
MFSLTCQSINSPVNIQLPGIKSSAVWTDFPIPHPLGPQEKINVFFLHFFQPATGGSYGRKPVFSGKKWHNSGGRGTQNQN